MTKRAEYMFALYEGSLAEPGDRNPYADHSRLLAKLWLRGYERMLRVRVETGPAMARYTAARADVNRGRVDWGTWEDGPDPDETNAC